ncbi:MAG: hypothetical protein RX318_03860 [bacterium]|nr:hypothetical protein [bacterium]
MTAAEPATFKIAARCPSCAQQGQFDIGAMDLDQAASIVEALRCPIPLCGSDALEVLGVLTEGGLVPIKKRGETEGKPHPPTTRIH